MALGTSVSSVSIIVGIAVTVTFRLGIRRLHAVDQVGDFLGVSALQRVRGLFDVRQARYPAAADQKDHAGDGGQAAGVGHHQERSGIQQHHLELTPRLLQQPEKGRAFEQVRVRLSGRAGGNHRQTLRTGGGQNA